MFTSKWLSLTMEWNVGEGFLSCVAFCRHLSLFISPKMNEHSIDVSKHDVVSESHWPGLVTATERHIKGDWNKKKVWVSAWKLLELFGVWSLGQGHCAPSQSCQALCFKGYADSLKTPPTWQYTSVFCVSQVVCVTFYRQNYLLEIQIHCCAVH